MAYKQGGSVDPRLSKLVGGGIVMNNLAGDDPNQNGIGNKQKMQLGLSNNLTQKLNQMISKNDGEERKQSDPIAR